jgi:amino acid adenylation domain-containing protein
LNPNIDFDNSPFVVQQELAEWKRLFKDGEEIPRRAGISAFGAGGVNAHVVIEEYAENGGEGRGARGEGKGHGAESIESRDEGPGARGGGREHGVDSKEKDNEGPYLIVLSARNEERLRAYAANLLDYIDRVLKVETRLKESGQDEIRNSNPPDQGRTRLENISFTMQVGREAMEERLGILVKSTRVLSEKLQGFLSGETVEDLYRGQVKRNKAALSVFTVDEDMAKAIDAWIDKRKYAKLLNFWVNGGQVDWQKLYDQRKTNKPRRISLPTYPFARERCWVPEGRRQRAESREHRAGDGVRMIHPLLHENTSDLRGLRFSSTFTGEEFFLADHQVNGQRVLPGVAYLEMARAGVQKAAGVLKDEQTGIRLKNVVWASPFVAGDRPAPLHIGLFPGEEKEIAYEIYSESEDDDSERVVHSQGSVLPGSVPEVPLLDIEALKSECDQRILSSDRCYEIFKAMGIDYGPGHRGIEKVYAGSGQVLAKLSLPSLILDTQDQFMLHPSLMDSALQASIGLMQAASDSGRSADHKPALPFALETLEILGDCTQKMWAFVRKNGGGKVQKLDIDLSDETGKVCVRIKGFASRVLESAVDSEGFSATPGTLLLQPVWKEKAIDSKTAAPGYGRHLVMLCEFSESIKTALAARMPGVRCIRFQTKESDIADRFRTYVEKVFIEIRGIIEEKPETDVLVQIVVPIEGKKRLFSALSGLLKTARMENPKIIGQLIVSEADSHVIAERLNENRQSPMDTDIRYHDGKRLVSALKEIEPSLKEPGIPWKDNGVYLISGGAGGLGFIFAKEVVEKVSDATLILTGRSLLNADKKAQLKELEAGGAVVQYRQTDVTRKDAVTDLVRCIRKDFGTLNGIIHSAGVIRDNFILKKTEAELQEVLAPKVSGLVNLDDCGKDLPLDFFILFSSVAGAAGNIGQADYACANAFMDAYAAYRNELVRAKQRQGRTISINWPLWKDGGMRVDKETEKMMKQSTGIIPMGTATGIRVFYQALVSAGHQIMALEGDILQMKRDLFPMPVLGARKTGKAAPAAAEAVLREKSTAYIKNLVGESLKIPGHRIDASAPLEKYGIDSITAVNVTNILRKIFDNINSTLFFEYQTIDEVTEHLINTRKETLSALVGGDAPGGEGPDVQTVFTDPAVLREKATAYLKNILGEALKIPTHRIDASLPLEKYGIDSIIAVKVTNILHKVFTNINSTLFFEYQTIDEVVEHLINTRKEILVTVVGAEEHGGGHPDAADCLRVDDPDDTINEEIDPAPPRSENRAKRPLESDLDIDLPVGEMDNPIKIPLSEGQKGLWLLHRYSPEMGAYNVPMAFRSAQGLDIRLLKNACRYILKRYPILGSAIVEDNGMPYQITHPNRNLPFWHENIEHLKDVEILPYLKAKAKAPFDLKRGPFIRIHLLSRSEQDHILLIVIHHMVFDGSSTVLFFKSLMEAYFAYSIGNEPEPVKFVTTFRDFVKWEQKMLTGPEGREHLIYWKKQLDGELPVLSLPADHQRPSEHRFEGNTHTVVLNPALALKARALVKSEGINLSVLFLGIFKAFLYRYTGENDIIVGMPTRGRPQPCFEDVMGYFVNMIPVRSSISGDQGFMDYLKILRATVFEGLSHADYPFPVLVKALKMTRNRAYAPVFQVSFSYQNFLQPIRLMDLHSDSQSAFHFQFIEDLYQEGEDDFGLEIYDEKDRFALRFAFNPELFKTSTIKKMAEHYIRLIEEITDNPGLRIADFSMLTDTERARVMSGAGGGYKEYDNGEPVHEFIQACAEKTPEATALVFAGRRKKRVTYRQLNERANRLADYLKHKGLKLGAPVGLCLERCPEMIIGLLAILKSGGVYVPLDPDNPDDRLKIILKDARIKLILAHDSTEGRIQSIIKNEAAIINLNRDKRAIGRRGKKDPKTMTDPDIPAYVIYTSGSTGRPKGVVVTHASIADHCRVIQEYCDITPNDHILQFAPLNVDTSLEQILPGLMTGATLILRNELWSPETFRKMVLAHKITLADIPPAYFNELLVQWSGAPDSALEAQLRLVMVGGEAISPETVDLWQKSCLKSARLINAYGPTETTITRTAFEINTGTWRPGRFKSVPIGRPLKNTAAYILDEDGNPVPDGVTGELHIGGSGVAMGYLNRPELTAVRFIPDPFAGKNNTGDSRLYKTGDLARYLPESDGLIEFLGRRDHQVKIRGFRVELGEIETVLTSHRRVKKGVVIIRKDRRDENQLIAYVVTDQGRLTVKALKNFMKKKLPDYMQPLTYVMLDEFPMTSGGKVDRRALPEPDAAPVGTGKGAVFPRDDIEMKLARIWAEVLDIPEVGIHDNFFDLGGHSIQAIRLSAKIQEALDGDLSIAALIQGPTIEEQADLLRRKIGMTSASPLVAIHAGGDKAPFFCIHPVGGNVLPYMGLAHCLGEHHPFYGLQSPGLDGGDPLCGIEEMASVYIAAMRKISPEGPYNLGGWSLGGVVAYEMARQLRQQKESVALLALIESYTPAVVEKIERRYFKANKLETYDDEVVLLLNFAGDLLGFNGEKMPVEAPGSTASPSELFNRIKDLAERSNLLVPGKSEEQMRRLFRVFEANTQAMSRYHPKPYDGRITLFCGDESMGAGADPEFGWGEMAGGGLLRCDVSGNHYTIIKEPHVRRLAEALRGSLDSGK